MENYEEQITFCCQCRLVFISHRLRIAEEAMKNGFEVMVACKNTGRSNEITNKGIEFIDLRISRSSTNLISELFTLFDFYKIYNNIKPDIVHHITKAVSMEL